MVTETFFMASLFGASIPCAEYEDALFLEGMNELNSEEEWSSTSSLRCS